MKVCKDGYNMCQHYLTCNPTRFVRTSPPVHSWFSSLPSRSSPFYAAQAAVNNVLFGGYFTQAGLQTVVSHLHQRFENSDSPEWKDDPDVTNLCKLTSSETPASVFSTLLENCELHKVVGFCIDDTIAFAEEKFGYSPIIEHITVCDETLLEVELVPPFLYFSVMELLKNSVVATVARYGILDVEDAPPIQVRRSKDVFAAPHMPFVNYHKHVDIT